MLETALYTSRDFLTPTILPSELRDPETISKAKCLLQRSEQEQIAIVNYTAERRYAAEAKSIPPVLLGEQGNQIREEWLQTNYYSILEEIILSMEGGWLNLFDVRAARLLVLQTGVKQTPRQLKRLEMNDHPGMRAP
jgi:hypothetical protein